MKRELLSFRFKNIRKVLQRIEGFVGMEMERALGKQCLRNILSGYCLDTFFSGAVAGAFVQRLVVHWPLQNSLRARCDVYRATNAMQCVVNLLRPMTCFEPANWPSTYKCNFQ